MKKIFLCLILAAAVFSLYAEKGYNGLNWYDTFQKIRQKQILELVAEGSGEDCENIDLYKSTARILNKQNEKFYIFNHTYLEAIFYTLENTKENLNSILSKYNNLEKIAKNEFFISNETQDNFKPEELGNMTLAEWVVFLCIMRESGELENEVEKKFFTDTKKGNTTIYTTQYNEDTRVYILSNFIEGKILVCYFKSQQDF